MDLPRVPFFRSERETRLLLPAVSAFSYQSSYDYDKCSKSVHYSIFHMLIQDS